MELTKVRADAVILHGCGTGTGTGLRLEQNPWISNPQRSATHALCSWNRASEM